MNSSSCEGSSLLDRLPELEHLPYLFTQISRGDVLSLSNRQATEQGAGKERGSWDAALPRKVRTEDTQPILKHSSPYNPLFSFYCISRFPHMGMKIDRTLPNQVHLRHLKMEGEGNVEYEGSVYTILATTEEAKLIERLLNPDKTPKEGLLSSSPELRPRIIYRGDSRYAFVDMPLPPPPTDESTELVMNSIRVGHDILVPGHTGKPYTVLTVTRLMWDFLGERGNSPTTLVVYVAPSNSPQW